MKGPANLRSRLLLATSLVLAGSTAQAAVEIDTDFATEFLPDGVYEQSGTAQVQRYNDVLRAPGGDYVLVGFQFESGKTPALVVTRLSPDGTEQWTRALTPPGTPTLVRGEAATIDGSDRILIAGWVVDQNDGTNIAIARLTAGGDEDQFKIAEIDTGTGTQESRARDVALDSDGNAYIVGETFAIGTQGEADGLVARFEAAELDDGNDTIAPEWAATDFGVDTETRYEAAAIDEIHGHLVAVGWTTDTGVRQHIIDRIDLTSELQSSRVPNVGIGTDGAITAAYGLDLDGTNALITGIIDKSTGKTDAFVQRLDGNNQPDPAFGTDGMTTILAPVGSEFNTLSLRDIVIDTQGGHLVTGAAGEDNFGDGNRTLDANEEVVVGRLLPDGSADTVFALGDTEGYNRFIYRANDSATRHVAEAITVDEAGRFLVAGSYNSDPTDETGTQNQASAMAFTADALTADDGSGDGSNGGGGGGGAFGPPLLLFGLVAMTMTVRRRLHA